MPASRRARRRSRRPARRRRGRTAGCARACRSARASARGRGSTTSSVPPGATASSRLRTPRSSGVRGIDAYCADTRSNAAGSNASSALASAWWHSIVRPRRSASAATRSSARCEMSLAVTLQPCSASQTASPPSPAPTSRARPGGEAADLVDERAVRVAAPHLVAAVAVIPVGLVGRRSGGGLDVLVGEAEADHAADPAAVGGGLQHLLARVGHVAGRVEPRHRRRAGRVGLDEVAEPGRVRRRLETERRERLRRAP